jgi:HPt (histidine-containing phosphotransfer) domain-containing protein
MQSYSSSLIDLSFLSSISKESAQTMLKYIKIFLEDAPPQINLLQKAIELKEWNSIESIAHALKSQLNFIGAKSISLIAGKIKETAETGIERNSLPAQFRELKIQFQSACDELINVRDNLMAKG